MAQVYAGRRVYTKGGLTKKDLKMNKRGKVVSKKQSSSGKKSFKGLQKWCDATEQARRELNIKGFQAIKKGTPFYKRAKEIYES